MAFGQSAGPPATHRQITTLLSLLNDIGHSDFRDARGPMGLNQRQAGGRFTRDEADALIERLTEEADTRELLEALDDEITQDTIATSGQLTKPERTVSAASPRKSGPRTTTSKRARPEVASVRQMSSDILATELQRRGWVVIEP